MLPSSSSGAAASPSPLDSAAAALELTISAHGRADDEREGSSILLKGADFTSSSSSSSTALPLPSPNTSAGPDESISAPSPSPAAPSPSDPTTDPSTSHFRAHVQRDRYMLLHKAIYFVGMGANASIYPFLVLRFRSLGLSDLESGVIMASSHLVNLLIGPAVANFADRSEHHRRGVLLVGFTVGGLCGFALGYARTFWPAFLSCVLMDSFFTGVWPILDASVHACLEATEGHSKSYGATRAFGAAGWGIWAWCAGAIFDRYGLDAMGPTLLLALTPILPLVWFVPVEKRGATTASTFSAWRKLLTVDVLIFLVVVYITAILLCVVDVYRTPFLAELGASNELLGFSITTTSISEFPFFFVAGYFLKRLPVPAILLAVLLAYSVRMFWYSVITDPWLTIPAELLHGIQFALGWAASTTYVATLLPPSSPPPPRASWPRSSGAPGPPRARSSGAGSWAPTAPAPSSASAPGSRWSAPRSWCGACGGRGGSRGRRGGRRGGRRQEGGAGGGLATGAAGVAGTAGDAEEW
jgi:MFS transporter, PPP family, 3-phenylpropionic acid transporter